VDDVDATVRAAVEAGGTQIYEAFDISGIGRIGGFFDPQGGAMNVITPAP
jgi:predicted enzyme related to lactoylglutathione lyase